MDKFNEMKGWILFFIFLLISILFVSLGTASNLGTPVNQWVRYDFEGNWSPSGTGTYTTNDFKPIWGQSLLFNTTYKIMNNYSYETTGDGIEVNVSPPGSNYALGCWISFSQTGKNQWCMGIFEQFNGGTYDCQFAVVGDTSEVLKLWYATSNSGGSKTQNFGSYSAGGWNHFILYHNATKYDVLLNGTVVTSVSSGAMTCSNWGIRLSDDYGLSSGGNGCWGKIDNCYFINRTLTSQDITDMLNTTPDNGEPSTPVNNPPEIRNITQSPINATVLQIAEFGINVSAYVNDTDINQNTIKLNLTLNATNVFINGSLSNNNVSLSYDSNDNTTYKWILDEQQLLGGTFNLNPLITENESHLYSVLNGINDFLKIEFLNVSNTINQSFAETYNENSSTNNATVEYWYCNSNYTSGIVTTSQYCTLFSTLTSNNIYNHVHKLGLSKHKILPMNINTTSGTLNNVYVTPRSYILIRGTQSGQNWYYVNNGSRQNTTGVSTNNGNSYTYYPTRTPDAHIHQIDSKSGWNFNICASDNANQTTCSIWYSNIPGFPELSPTAVQIYSPLNLTYNVSILINHSQSFPDTNHQIVNYTYLYAPINTTSYVYIGTNNPSTFTYTWLLDAVEDGSYYVRVCVFDSYNLSSCTNSLDWQKITEVALNTQLLHDINETNTQISLYTAKIYDTLDMIPLVLIYALFMIIGYHMVTHGNMWSGFFLYAITIGMDFLFIGYFQDKYLPLATSTSFYGNMVTIFIIFMWLWILGKCLGMIIFRVNRYKYQYTNVRR